MRRAWFNQEVMVRYLPKEILPGELLAGARFNVMTSVCLTKKETQARDRLVYNPMPPAPGQVCPSQPIQAVTEF